MKETPNFEFYVIACYGKKDRPYEGDKADRFVGYWYIPLMGESLQRIGKARHYTTREEADRDCKELNEDRDRWYYGKVQKYTATLASDYTATGSPFDTMSPEERNAVVTDTDEE